MLWEILSKYKVFLSLSFCTLFSIISLLWQKNPITYSTLYFTKLSEQTNFLLKNLLNIPNEILQRIFEYKVLKEKYEKSIEEIEKYKSQKEQYEILLKENQKLRELLNFEKFTIYPEIKAQVLGIRLNSITPKIIINVGKKHNIKPFMPVIAYTNDENRVPIRAVVGITAIVQENTTIIQPLQHPQMKLGVKIENTNQWAILEGNSYSFKQLKLKYISNLTENINVFFSNNSGDIRNSKIVTSGNDGIFPPNILVGIVTNKTTFDEEGFSIAYVQPYISLDKLDFVIIILKEPEEWLNNLQEEETIILKNPFSDFIIPENFSLNYKKEIQEKIDKKNIDKKTQIETNNQNNEEVNTEANKKNTPERKIIINPNDPFQQ